MILASKSPRRKEILEMLDFNLIIHPSNIIETSSKENIYEKVMDISNQKAKDVAKVYPLSYIVSADTTVLLNDEMIGKPNNRAEGREILEKLSGVEHEVVTSYTFLNIEKNIEINNYIKTIVKFRKLDNDTINWYLDTNDYIDKAGSYGIQGYGSILIDYIKGDFYNVMGFPIADFICTLNQLGINLSDIKSI